MYPADSKQGGRFSAVALLNRPLSDYGLAGGAAAGEASAAGDAIEPLSLLIEEGCR
jgi:hypothetical protein